MSRDILEKSRVLESYRPGLLSQPGYSETSGNLQKPVSSLVKWKKRCLIHRVCLCARSSGSGRGGREEERGGRGGGREVPNYPLKHVLPLCGIDLSLGRGHPASCVIRGLSLACS